MFNSKSNSDDPKYWYDWLLTGMELEHLSKDPWSAFEGMKHPFGHEFELPQLIAQHYNKHTPIERHAFREGLIHCIETLTQNDTRYVPIFRDLIFICIETNTYAIMESEIFDKLFFKTHQHLLISEDGEQPILYLSCLKAIEHFATYGNGERIVNLCLKVIKSPWFSHELTYYIFQLLCIARPNNIFENWLMVRDYHMDFLESSYGSKDNLHKLPILRTQLKLHLDAVQLSEFQLKLMTFKDYCYSDEWLIALMLESNANIYEVIDDNEEPQLYVVEVNQGRTKYPLIQVERKLVSGKFYSELNRRAKGSETFANTGTAEHRESQYVFLKNLLKMESEFEPNSVPEYSAGLSAIANTSMTDRLSNSKTRIIT